MKFTVPRVWEMAFRKLSAIICGSSLLTDKSHIRFDVPPGERLSRFLAQDGEYSRAKNIVRYPAFLPPKTLRESVYWTSRIAESEIWAIGAKFVAPWRGPIHGRADVNSLVVYQVPGLAVDLTGKPHPRHADIVGWDADRKKAKLQALRLADEATLILQSAP